MLKNKQWRSALNKIVGNNLAAIMRQLNIRQSRLALMLDVDKSFVHTRLSGRSPMTASDIVAIREALGLSRAETKRYYEALFSNTTKIEVIHRAESNSK